MLRYLRVASLAVVREAEIELQPGLTALTGETGAGKSILVDALTLLLGARASADLVRTGAGAASVEAIFRVEGNREALAVLDELGVAAEEGEVVLRREVPAGGKGRAWVGGSLQPVAALRRLGAALADVYGQHEHVRLLDPSTHLDLLDGFAGLAAERAELGRAWRRLAEAEAALRALEASAAERARKADFLAFELREIEGTAPAPSEDEELGRERGVLANRARLLAVAEGGFQELYERDGSVLGTLAALEREIEEGARLDPGLAPLASPLAAARASLEDVALTLRDYARGLPLDAGRLDEVETRLAALGRLQAKYGPGLEDVLGFAARAREELRGLLASDQERALREKARDEARASYARLAEAASRARRAAARKLEARVEEELRELAMEKTRFRVRLSAGEAGPAGTDRAELHVSANVGEEPRPLARVASGGELSRLLLALRSVSSAEEPARVAVFHGLEARSAGRGLEARGGSGLEEGGPGGRVAVFDEVDAGIGGRVAFVLARKLKRLAEGRQVLCITHLAPVAAAADHHLAVRKEERRGRTEVRVDALDEDERVGELARMIGGDSPTEAVRRHAEELLASCGNPG